ncbi:MAG: hypothetical protein ACLQFR_26900 [Streptosporangiaceae bacterium]
MGPVAAMLDLQDEVGLPDRRIWRHVRIGKAALACMIEHVGAVNPAVRGRLSWSATARSHQRSTFSR